VDVTGNITAKICEVWNEFSIFANWLPLWICSTPPNLPHTSVDIPTKFHEVWWKESNFF
jgi:hypothetical protein